MAKISIIIPVYNTEEYLKECIESILAQSFVDFEAIFIDDGSQDASFPIINEFANCDKRIKVYHQENAGVSAARNLGLRYATGEYIVFIDSDDAIDSDYLNQLYQCAVQCSPDIVFSGIIYMKNGRETSRVVLDEEFLSLQTEDDLIHFFNTPLLPSPVLKLYKRKIVCDNHLQFDTSISCAEDLDFNLQYFQHIHNAYALSYCGYYYRNVENSLSHKRYDYRFCVEHRHWQMKRRMFESLQDFNSKGISYLVNQLFFITYNEMSDIVRYTQSIEDMMKTWGQSLQHIDFVFLTKNYRFLEQPTWMKLLLRMRLFRIIFLILMLKK